MKLTKAQAQVMEDAKRRIDYARTHDFTHWVAKNLTSCPLETDWDSFPNPYLSNAKALQNALDIVAKDSKPVVIDGIEIFPANHNRTEYEEEKMGYTITMASSNTLRALERMGLIEIIEDAGRGVDSIRVLNY